MRYLAALFFLSQVRLAQAADRPIADILVLGAAQGLILGVIGIGYFFWKRYQSRRLSEKIATSLPDIIIHAADGNDVKVSELLDLGINPNASGPAGQTALMLAARNGHRATVELLLNRGADPNRQTRTGSTAADIAKTYKHSDCESLLSSRAEKQ